jgi:hypothetical protein
MSNETNRKNVKQKHWKSESKATKTVRQKRLE